MNNFLMRFTCGLPRPGPGPSLVRLPPEKKVNDGTSIVLWYKRLDNEYHLDVINVDLNIGNIVAQQTRKGEWYWEDINFKQTNIKTDTRGMAMSAPPEPMPTPIAAPIRPRVAKPPAPVLIFT